MKNKANEINRNSKQMDEGFKQTDIGLIPVDWEELDFEYTLSDNDFSHDNLIPSSEFKSEGKYPIIDQGQDYIAGYTDLKSKVYKVKEPVVLFGDHTRIIKYIDFPFVGGADGIKIFTPNSELFNSKFYYYALTHLRIPSRGYNRHYKLLKENKVVKPPLSEQKNIAHVLSKIQETIETQEQIIKTTQELKKALMQKLFTEGLNGEPQKQTEIGSIPESWEVVDLEKTGDVVYGIQASVAHLKEPIGLPILTNKNITLDGEIDLSKLNYFELKTKRHFATVLKKGDILFNWRSGSKEHVGKTAYFNLEGEYVHSSFILRIRPKNDVNNKYLFYYLTYLRLSEYFIKLHSYSINAKFNKSAVNKLPTVLPPLVIQELIADYLTDIDMKITTEENRLLCLKDLFSSSLNNLMTGQIRVKDIEFKLVT